jgi:hypothetical protein
MALLNRFDYEVFLSYGWAGSTDADEGARRWVGDLYDVLFKYLSENLERPRIYFDRDARRVGTIPDGLLRAVERSATMIFVVSPGSYRLNSWCQKEVVHFWDHAQPLVQSPEIVSTEDRILKVIQSPPTVVGTGEPIPLRDLYTFDLFERVNAGGNEFKQAGNLLQPESERLQKEIENLCGTLRAQLERVKKLETSAPSGKKVFLGASFSPLDRQRYTTLRRELLLEGHQVCSLTSLPEEAESEEEYRGRIEHSLENVQLAVELVPQPLQNPAGWQRNRAAWQISFCLRKSHQSTDFSVYLWKDPDKASFDSQCLDEIKNSPPTQGDQHPEGMIFENLKVNIKELLRKPAYNRPETPGVMYDVIIEHNDVDTTEADRIRNHLEKLGQSAQFAYPTYRGSNRLRREKKNKAQFYSRARRFLVVYGRTDDEWTNDVCFAMKDYIGSKGGGLVVVAPPPGQPITKNFYRPPDQLRFVTQHCPNGQYEQAIDEWLLNSGGPLEATYASVGGD